MAHQTLYRRFRPQTFAEVRGQDNLVRALRQAVAEERVGHAYLFSGPRGTGKTTTARVLAKALNCMNATEGEPCGTCASCTAIAEGTSFDVIELDAASNRGVDDIRQLRENAGLGTPGRFKVYILDEVHMLTTDAANALLKTLEEPPEHVVFVLATTDPQKVPATVRSRTQHYDVHLLNGAELAALVDNVAAEAGLDVDETVRDWAVRTGAGSARDTLSALERAVALGGVPDDATPVDGIVDALGEGDTAGVLAGVAEAVAGGLGARRIGDDLLARLRQVFLAAVDTMPDEVPETDRARIAAQAERLGPRGASHALDVLGHGLSGIAYAPDPRVTLELALVRITRPELDDAPGALAARLERLEALLAGGPPPHVGATPGVPPGASPGTGHASGTGDTGAGTREGDAQVVDTPSAAPAAGGGDGGDAPAAQARQRLASVRKPAGDRPGRAPARPVTPAGAPGSSASPAPRPSTPDAGGSPADGAVPAPGDAPPAAAPVDSPVDSPVGSPVASDVDTPVGSPAVAVTLPGAEAAWQQVVQASSNQKLRVRLGSGRVVGVRAADSGGTDVEVAVPNDRVRQRGLEVCAEAGAALAEHLGGTVSVTLVVGAPAGGGSAAGGSGPSGERSTGGGSDEVAGGTGRDSGVDAAEEADEVGDVHSLPDAPEAGADGVDMVAGIFGSDIEVVEEEPAP
jgi:DNA polymerase-3 subunit gamma/tau